MRRVCLLIGAVLLLAGCSAEEGLRAQELLQQAEAAQAAVSSSTFDGSLSFSYDGQEFAMRFEGATSKDGEWFSLHASDIPGAGDFSMQMLVRGGRAWTSFGGRWQQSPAPTAGSGGSLNGAAFQQLARYVKDVRVTEHQQVGAKLVTTIGGEIDTQAMVGALAKLGPLAGEEGFDLSKLGVRFGDIEALLTIDERTHLLDTAMIELGLEAQGRQLDLELRYRLTSVGEPVALPSPTG